MGTLYLRIKTVQNQRWDENMKQTRASEEKHRGGGKLSNMKWNDN